MFCNICGKSIPDESVFCLYCGNKINLERENNKNESISTPEYIGYAFFKVIGPVKERSGKGFLSLGQVGRWINFGINLCDNLGHNTKSNGSVIVAVNPSGKLGPLNSYKGFHELATKATFFGEYEVTLDHFKSGLNYVINTEFIFFKQLEIYMARIGFRLPSGIILENPKGLKTFTNQDYKKPEIQFL